MMLRVVGLFFRPSLFSGAVVLVGAIGIIGAANWPYFTYNQALFSLLYGEFGAVTALEQSPALTEGLLEAFLQNPVLYGAVMLVAALVMGLLAFLLIKSIRQSIHSVEELEDMFERRSVLQRVAARLFVGSMWLLYGYVFAGFIVPFCLLLSRIGAEAITTAPGILMNIGAFLFLLLALHAHVVFARLFLLRPRVFGGRAVVEEAVFSHGSEYRH